MGLEYINNWAVAIASIISGGVSYLIHFKLNKKKQKTETEKDIKINSVKGDQALIDQLDSLMDKIASMSVSMIKIQGELTELGKKELSYQTAIHKMRLHCKEFCNDTELCLKCIDRILRELNLNDDK